MQKMTVNPVACAVVAALALGAHSAYADGAEKEIVEAEPSIGLPSVEAGAFYRSMKIERGMVENKESVFGYEAEIEWYGFFLGIESCHDMTNVEGRRGLYNEIETEAGYRFSLGDFTAKAAYVYKACGGDEHNTQEIELEMEYETPWFTPFVECNLDIDDKAGALYGAAGLSREWEFSDWAKVNAYAGIGAGNAYRNRTDFGADKIALRDMHVGAELEIELCPHVKLVPGVDLYDQFTSQGRHEYHKGFVAVGGVKLVVEF
ncbi:MAG: hypothetical protein IKQ17_07710 [Kiritimatiellae bacterium]|nr:hypothetical protein [Kiritimatiellia bacterium]